MKKLVSILVALIMILSCTAALAEENTRSSCLPPLP